MQITMIAIDLDKPMTQSVRVPIEMLVRALALVLEIDRV
jgi:hypothetical protein